MNNIGDKGNFFKNPIGVIGIFLVLTEAIASTVIVKSNLNDFQNTILVIFVVLFPCLVLGVFICLSLSIIKSCIHRLTIKTSKILSKHIIIIRRKMKA